MTRMPESTPEFSDVAAAFGLLTRLPVPVDGARAAARGAAGAWAYPVVGIAVGGLSAGVMWTASGLGSGPAAALGLIASVAATGALHEDGLSDSVDGLWGGWTRERRLEIMKDSRIGAYGVMALVLSVLLRWSLAVTLIEGGPAWGALIAAAALSRAGMVWVWAALPPARPNGLAAGIGRPRPATALLAGLVSVAGLILLPFGMAFAAIAAAIAATVAVGAIARAKIGGQTGDILGAAQQVAECAILMAIVAALA